MPWMIKPGLNRRRGRVMYEAAFLAPQVEAISPADEGLFMSSTSIIPEYPTGTDTTDVFVGAIYVDTAGLPMNLHALIGTTKTGVAVTLKAKITYSTTDEAEHNGTLSTSNALASCSVVGNMTSVAGYYYFYISCASTECSWQCYSISLVK